MSVNTFNKLVSQYNKNLKKQMLMSITNGKQSLKKVTFYGGNDLTNQKFHEKLTIFYKLTI